MAAGGEPDLVLVTGASGYIASHLIRSLLIDGVYRVRGTVRNLQATEKVKPVRDLEPSDVRYPLELVEADLLKKEGWIEAVRGCKYVYHVASPFPGTGNDLTREQQQERIIKPAVDGTLNVLQACAEVGGVKRVVVTSSVAAISCGNHGIPSKPADYVYTEEDWSEESVSTPYELSKTKAEKAAWDFVEKLEEDKKFELAVVNPSYVQGPLLSAASGGGTQLLLKDVLNGKVPAVPNVHFGLVDVRDVVDLHKAVMEKPEGAGKRYIACNLLMPFKDIVAIVKEEFGSQGYSIPSIPLPKIGMWVFKFFDKGARDVYDSWGLKVTYSNERMKSIGVEPRPIRDTILDTCYSLIELGLAVKKPRYRGPSDATGELATQDKPASTEEKPAEEDKPAESQQKPSESEDKPAESEDKPAESEDKPAESEDKPAESEDKPAESEDKLAESEDKPAESEDKPAESEDKTAESEDKPAESEDKPVE